MFKLINRLRSILIIVVIVVTMSGCYAKSTFSNNPNQESAESKSTSSETSNVQDTSSENNSTTDTTLEGDIAHVARVIDGDTIVCEFRGVIEKIRLIGIDTPEKGKPYYREATDAMKKLVLDKNVRLVQDVSAMDRYGRLLRYVYIDNTFVNAKMVEQGYALQATFPPDVKYAETFRMLAKQACDRQLGLWSNN